MLHFKFNSPLQFRHQLREPFILPQVGESLVVGQPGGGRVSGVERLPQRRHHLVVRPASLISGRRTADRGQLHGDSEQPPAVAPPNLPARQRRRGGPPPPPPHPAGPPPRIK